MALSYGGELPQVRSVINCFLDWDEYAARRNAVSGNIPREAFIAKYPSIDPDCMSIKAGDGLWTWKTRASKGAMPYVWGCFNDVSVMRSNLNGSKDPDDFSKMWNWLTRQIRFIGIAVTDYAFDPAVRSGGPSGGVVAARSGTIKCLNVGPRAITPGSLVKIQPPTEPQTRVGPLKGYPRHRVQSEFVPWDPTTLMKSKESMQRYFRLDSADKINAAYGDATKINQDRRFYTDETAEKTAEFIKICAYMGVHLYLTHANQYANVPDGYDLEKLFGIKPLTTEERTAGIADPARPDAYRLTAAQCEQLNHRNWSNVGTETALLALCMGVSNSELVGGAPSVACRSMQQGGLERLLRVWQDVLQEDLSRVVGVSNSYADPGEYFMLHLRAAIP